MTLRAAVPAIAIFVSPCCSLASEDVLVRTFQAAYDSPGIRIVPVWFVAWSALPEELVSRMCKPNLVNGGRLAPSPDLNLLSLYGLIADVNYDVERSPEFTLDLSGFRMPEKLQVPEEVVLKAAVECLRRIAGDLGIAKIYVVVRPSAADSSSRWRNIEGEYESVLEPGR